MCQVLREELPAICSQCHQGAIFQLPTRSAILGILSQINNIVSLGIQRTVCHEVLFLRYEGNIEMP